MKPNHVFLMLSIIAISVVDSHAQYGWFWQNPLPCGNRLNDVCFVDPNKGIAVGDFGTILRTSDGGNNWILQASGTTRNLNRVSFADDRNGAIVGTPGGFSGGGGVILTTTDGGQSWISQLRDTTIYPMDVCFTDANNGTVVGYRPNDVSSQGIVLRTTDGGNSWAFQPVESTQSFASVCFTDADNGTAVGEGWNGNGFGAIILKTTDGGSNWVTQWRDTTGVSLYDVCFMDASNGTVVGDQWDGVETKGTILRTTDGGNHWIAQSSGTTQSLRDVCFVDVNTGIAVGYGGTILRTTDGGSHWISQSSEATYELEGVCFTDANIGTVVGSGWNGTYVEGIILRTVDGGNHWIRQSGTDDYVHCYLYDVCYTDANIGTAVGRGQRKTDGIHGGIILRTTDGGKQWNVQYTGTNGFSAVYSTDPNTATVVGGQGAILRTTTGGVASLRQQQNDDVPTHFSMSQNYPNPFNPSTTIKYELPRSTVVRLTVYDMLGREVSVLVNERRDAGVQEVKFDGSNLASGVYFYRLQAGDFTQTKRLILLR